MRKLQCETCGGLVDRNTLTCRSCGMQYKFDFEEHLMPLVIEERKMDILHGKVILPDFILQHDPEQAVEHAIKQIAENMARDLIPYMEWERESDPIHMETSIYARIRVARPTGERRLL